MDINKLCSIDVPSARERPFVSYLYLMGRDIYYAYIFSNFIHKSRQDALRAVIPKIIAAGEKNYLPTIEIITTYREYLSK